MSNSSTSLSTKDTTPPPSNPYANSNTDYTEIPLTGSTLGALSYNLNSMLGWMLGAPTPSGIYLYSDLAFVSSTTGGAYFDFATGSPSDPLFTANDSTYSDQTLVKAVSEYMTYGDHTVFVTQFTEDDYKTQFGSKDGLMGMSWLPWNVYGIQNSAGDYSVKTLLSGSPTPLFVTCNPLRREIMYIKLFTILKLLGISLGVYALIKLSLHYADKK